MARDVNGHELEVGDIVELTYDPTIGRNAGEYARIVNINDRWSSAVVVGQSGERGRKFRVDWKREWGSKN